MSRCNNSYDKLVNTERSYVAGKISHCLDEWKKNISGMWVLNQTACIQIDSVSAPPHMKLLDMSINLIVKTGII